MDNYDEEYDEEYEEEEECEEEIIDSKCIDMEDNIIYEQLIGLGDNILEALNLFVCTQSSKIINFDYTMSAFTKKIKDDFTEILSLKNSNELLNGDLIKPIAEHLPHFILAVNTNYEHFCQQGCEKELKLNCKKRKNNDQKKRQSQGDETIFHSAIQLNLLLNSNIEEYLNANKFIKKNAKANIKIYKIKLYPSTGRIQIPGIIHPDLSDGIQLVNKLINYINFAQRGGNTAIANEDSAAIANKDSASIANEDSAAIANEDSAAIANEDSASANTEKLCKIEEISIIMINYKTSLRNISPRMLFNLNSIGEYIQLLEDRYLYDGMTTLMPELANLLPVHKKNSFSKWNELILPPFLISDTKLKNNDKYISFIFIPFSTEVGPKKGRIATVKIFQRGKINILGVKEPKHAEEIYIFLRTLIMANIQQFVAIKIRPDSD